RVIRIEIVVNDLDGADADGPIGEVGQVYRDAGGRLVGEEGEVSVRIIGVADRYFSVAGHRRSRVGAKVAVGGRIRSEPDTPALRVVFAADNHRQVIIREGNIAQRQRKWGRRISADEAVHQLAVRRAGIFAGVGADTSP